MDPTSITLKHLCFTGPGKLPALIKFKRGLNVLYGASDTGKSFVLESIDFMLGGKELREIPESREYDRIFLGIEISNGKTYTLVRNPKGGQFTLFEGLIEEFSEGKAGKKLLATYKAGKEDNVSTFLLNQINLLNKQILFSKKNGTKKNLTFRALAHLCLINEGDIQKNGSPIDSGITTNVTYDYSVFKLLLTGIDDSTLVSSLINENTSTSLIAKQEIISEILNEFQSKLGNQNADKGSLTEQLQRLENSISEEKEILNQSEAHYQNLMTERAELLKKSLNGKERRAEIDELLARFALLDEHYKSDLDRLEGIREAGSLISIFEHTNCPLCGAEPEPHIEKKCDTNIKDVITAADAETTKINILRQELKHTIQQLSNEAVSFNSLFLKIDQRLAEINNELKRINPTLRDARDNYAVLIEKQSIVRSELNLLDQITDLEKKQNSLCLSINKNEEKAGQISTDIPSSVLDDFAKIVERILTAWSFPEAERVNFQEKDQDLIIAGKRRTSRGKGLRAITHAAFTIGLLEYCKEKNKSHPGFILLDSPLLAYREPDPDDIDLTETDFKDKFYEYLNKWEDRQIIIIENDDPPTFIQDLESTVHFSKNPKKGRYGFFP